MTTSKLEPYPTGRTHRGLPVMFNPGDGMECVSFKGMLYSLDVIDKAMDDCLRDAAPELLDYLKRMLDEANDPAGFRLSTIGEAMAIVTKAEGRS